jgi:hypothetical protein
MNTFRTAALALAIVAALTACNRDNDTARAAGDGTSSIESSVESNMTEAMDQARHELTSENISLDATGQPKAEITPKGDLLIDGKAVPVTDAQRAQLLAYRGHLVGVASAGMDVGVQGAKLATRAMGEAVRGIFSGEPDQIEKRVEAQAEPIRQAALKLCDRLPALFDAQQALAASLPAFAPYAKMDRDDIDDCRKDALDGKPQPPAPPAAPSPPAAPNPPPEGTGEANVGATAKDVIGKPELPDLPELPDVTG